ncbi:hypothetical protein VL10_23370 [Leclercia adecarboxylata]|nr:hypothetical protein VL10_23370 [Leclercia adecarboxylata]KMN66825.1 hypothetical protein VK95_04340 [Leclercia sp. LK8]
MREERISIRPGKTDPESLESVSSMSATQFNLLLRKLNERGLLPQTIHIRTTDDNEHIVILQIKKFE